MADPALLEEPELRDALMTYAVAGLENRRLEMSLRDSLHQLEDSRARNATAADSERQRIERDLHDGAQQRLVAVAIRLGMAADEMQRDPNAGAQLMRALGDQVELALEEVRNLAHGAHPSLLAERGLGDALRAVAREATLPATVDTDGVGRYSPQVESAVYFTCLEAMQNAAKHARGATRVAISLRSDHDLHFEVADDGAGLSPNYQEGAGIPNMRGRVADLGGSLTLQALPGHGTRVSGTIPLPGQPATDRSELPLARGRHPGALMSLAPTLTLGQSTRASEHRGPGPHRAPANVAGGIVLPRNDRDQPADTSTRTASVKRASHDTLPRAIGMDDQQERRAAGSALLL